MNNQSEVSQYAFRDAEVELFSQLLYFRARVIDRFRQNSRPDIQAQAYVNERQRYKRPYLGVGQYINLMDEVCIEAINRTLQIDKEMSPETIEAMISVLETRDGVKALLSSTQELLALIASDVKEKINLCQYPSKGICELFATEVRKAAVLANQDREDPFSVIAIARSRSYSVLRVLFMGWPKHSGVGSYPVPASNPIQEFESAEETGLLWHPKTRYGRDRMELMGFVLQKINNIVHHPGISILDGIHA